jgi:hypothetical protein
MTRDWESSFSSWTGAEGTVEEEKAQRTITRVRDAVSKSAPLGAINLSVYAKGSYPNRTNVVRDSDIDVAVELTSIWHHMFIHAAKNLGIGDIGLSPYVGPYNTNDFKNHVQAALAAEFGTSTVKRGNKSIRVDATSTTLPVDVVACQTVVVHTSRTQAHHGTLIRPDAGAEVINYPKQHLSEGLAKNTATSRRYKRTVRILKRLENEMVSKKVTPVVPSFLIESLVWNVGTATFNVPTTWKRIVRDVIVESYQAVERQDELLEANGIKFLFHPLQKWTREQATAFLTKAWNYVGLA